uniref:Uncharacterized protein n=1 Tax=Daphnia magna TaxID=35525 RepID=A0A0P5EW68_9CRUS
MTRYFVRILIAESGALVGQGGGNWEFVFMDWSNGELVDVDGSDGQVVTLGLESSIISNPGQSEFLAFRGNPVRGSFVGVSLDFTVGFLAVRVVGFALEFLLGVGLVAGGVVRLGVAPCTTAIDVALVRLASDGDVGVLVILVARSAIGSRGFVGRLVAGRSGGSNGQKSGNDEQFHDVVLG